MAPPRTEIRALLWLLPLLAVASWLTWEIARPSAKGRITVSIPQDQESAISRQQPPPAIPSDDVSPRDVAPTEEPASSAPQLFSFDPNTVEFHDLMRLGFTRGEALGIVKYRERGKVFQIPEDFAACYQVSEAMYVRLRPYIIIGERFRLKPFAQQEPTAPRQNPPPAKGETSERNFQPAAGEVEGGRLTGSPARALVELNSADSAALVSVSGIGALTAGRIIAYRARLGGFASPLQLAEIRGMTEQNYERILGQIFVDTLAIQKIAINFAPANVLAAHPYIRPEALRKLLKQRQLKGGWRTAEELIEDDIFTARELSRLRPYLVFN